MQNNNFKVKIPAVIKEAILNGTLISSNASQGERSIPSEDLPVIPFPKVYSNKNARTHNFVYTKDENLNIKLMVLICNSCNKNTLNIHELAIWRSVLYVCLTSGFMKTDALARYSNSQEQFENAMINIDINNLTEESAEAAEMAFNYLNVANNIISASVINFIRFNHHFGNNVINLNYKMFLPIPKERITNFISERNEFLQPFYETIYPCVKLINEIFWYYRVILNDVNKAPNVEYSLLNGPIINRYINADRLIQVRSIPTVNIFTPLSIIKLIIAKLEELNLAAMVITGDIAAKIICLDNMVRANPFSYHPSKDYFNIPAADYSRANNLKNILIERFGGLTASFCDAYGGTLQNARSVAKFIDLVTPLQTAVIAFYFELKQTGVRLTDDIKDYIRNKNMMQLRNIASQEELNQIVDDYTNARRLFDPNDLYAGI